MLIDVVSAENWEELNDQVKALLSLPAALRARSYNGIGHAVFEITQATAQFMSHKKSVGFVLGQTSVFTGILPYYYKETYEVTTVSHLQLLNVKEWVDNLKKDTNFVLFAEDHPVTGELYPFIEELDKLLNEKRIYSFRVSHFQHFHETVQIRPYTVRLCSFSPQSAVAIIGERFRSPSLMAQNMAWSKELYLHDLTKSRDVNHLSPSRIEAFEQQMAFIAAPYFPKGHARVFDRALIEFSDVSAEAMAHSLINKLGISSLEGWNKISTTNMCHWSPVKMFHQWWEPQPSMEQLRGLLVISAELLSIKDFNKLVIDSYQDIKAQQTWSI